MAPQAPQAPQTSMGRIASKIAPLMARLTPMKMPTILAGLVPALAALTLGCVSEVGRHDLPGPAAQLVGRAPTAREREILGRTGLVISSEARVPSFHLGYTA